MIIRVWKNYAGSNMKTIIFIYFFFTLWPVSLNGHRCGSRQINMNFSIRPHQIYTRDPRPPMSLRVMASWGCHGAQLGGLFSGFCRSHKQKLTQNKCVHDLCGPCSVLRLFVFTLRLVHADNTRTWRTTRSPPNLAPYRDQDGAGSRISSV